MKLTRSIVVENFGQLLGLVGDDIRGRGPMQDGTVYITAESTFGGTHEVTVKDGIIVSIK
jgi:hypothetical protein